MRVQAAVAAFVLLAFAGCSSPGPSAATAGPPRWITLDPVVLAEGAFEWHETGTGNALEYYELASQAVAHPCVWENPNGSEEVYFNNLRLPTGRASQGLGAWPGNLSLALDWTDQDWVGTALRIAYQAHGVEGWQETAPIERGTTLTVPIRVAAGNASADGEETEPAQGWSVWVCLPTDTGDPESPFMGSVQARVAFAPDPVLESELAPVEGEEGRTARGGGVPTQPAL